MWVMMVVRGFRGGMNVLKMKRKSGKNSWLPAAIPEFLKSREVTALGLFFSSKKLMPLILLSHFVLDHSPFLQ